MKDLQKFGGLAALIDTATYLVVMGLLFTLLAPMANENLEIGQFVAFAADNQALVYAWNTIAYIVNGLFLVILMLALHERLKSGAPAMVLAATVFGLIWAVFCFAGGLIDLYSLQVVIDLYAKDPAQAATVKAAVDTILSAINNSDRLLGGLWLLLINWAALRTSGLPKALNILGLLIGGVSFVSWFFPPLKDLVFVFGLGIIVWWAWLGIVMLRGYPNAAAQKAFAPFKSATNA